MTALVLLKDQTGLGKGPVVSAKDSSNVFGRRSIQVAVVAPGNGALTTLVRIYGMNDGRFPVAIMDFTLQGNGTVIDADDDDFPWEFYQAEIVSLSGTGAAVTVVASV